MLLHIIFWANGRVSFSKYCVHTHVRALHSHHISKAGVPVHRIWKVITFPKLKHPYNLPLTILCLSCLILSFSSANLAPHHQL